MEKRLTRREFLKLSAAGLGALASRPFNSETSDENTPYIYEFPFENSEQTTAGQDSLNLAVAFGLQDIYRDAVANNYIFTGIAVAGVVTEEMIRQALDPSSDSVINRILRHTAERNVYGEKCIPGDRGPHSLKPRNIIKNWLIGGEDANNLIVQKVAKRIRDGEHLATILTILDTVTNTLAAFIIQNPDTYQGGYWGSAFRVNPERPNRNLFVDTEIVDSKDIEDVTGKAREWLVQPAQNSECKREKEKVPEPVIIPAPEKVLENQSEITFSPTKLEPISTLPIVGGLTILGFLVAVRARGRTATSI